MSRSATNCSPSFGHIPICRLPCFVFCMWQTVAIGAPTLGKWAKCFCNEGISYTIWPTKCNKSCEGQGKCSRWLCWPQVCKALQSEVKAQNLCMDIFPCIVSSLEKIMFSWQVSGKTQMAKFSKMAKISRMAKKPGIQGIGGGCCEGGGYDLQLHLIHLCPLFLLILMSHQILIHLIKLFHLERDFRKFHQHHHRDLIL